MKVDIPTLVLCSVYWKVHLCELVEIFDPLTEICGVQVGPWNFYEAAEACHDHLRVQAPWLDSPAIQKYSGGGWTNRETVGKAITDIFGEMSSVSPMEKAPDLPTLGDVIPELAGADVSSVKTIEVPKAGYESPIFENVLDVSGMLEGHYGVTLALHVVEVLTTVALYNKLIMGSKHIPATIAVVYDMLGGGVKASSRAFITAEGALLFFVTNLVCFQGGMSPEETGDITTELGKLAGLEPYCFPCCKNTWKALRNVLRLNLITFHYMRIGMF